MTETTDVALFVGDNPVAVLTDRQKLDKLFADVVQEVEAHVPDLTTKKGRDAIKSLAFKVVRTKTAIDDAGKKLNEDAKAQIAKVDAVRREVRERLDELRDQARKPLNEWEAAEEARVEHCKAALEAFNGFAVISATDTPETLRVRLNVMTDTVFDPVKFDGWLASVTDARDRAVRAVEAGIERLIKEEADRAELERLRAAEAERVRKAEEVAERVRQREEDVRRREQEADRLAQAAEAEAQRISQAAENARRIAEGMADAQRMEIESKHRDEVEALQKAERDRLAAERAAEAQRKAREADQEHRGKIMRAAKEAIMAAGAIGEDEAKLIVLAIAAGNVPYVAMRF